MNKLEEQIKDILDDNIDGYSECKKRIYGSISKEIKDIAVEYSYWFNKLKLSKRERAKEVSPGTWRYVAIPDEELFNQFIEERYKDK